MNADSVNTPRLSGAAAPELHQIYQSLKEVDNLHETLRALPQKERKTLMKVIKFLSGESKTAFTTTELTSLHDKIIKEPNKEKLPFLSKMGNRIANAFNHISSGKLFKAFVKLENLTNATYQEAKQLSKEDSPQAVEKFQQISHVDIRAYANLAATYQQKAIDTSRKLEKKEWELSYKPDNERLQAGIKKLKKQRNAELDKCSEYAEKGAKAGIFECQITLARVLMFKADELMQPITKDEKKQADETMKSKTEDRKKQASDICKKAEDWLKKAIPNDRHAEVELEKAKNSLEILYDRLKE